MQLVDFNQENRQKWQAQLIACYKEVFAAPPWNEGWWTDELVLEVLELYAGANARIILAVEDKMVIGFAWGAIWTSGALSSELELTLSSEIDALVGYIKDIGVKAKYRNRNVALTLLRELCKKLKIECPEDSVVYARTLAYPTPSVVYLWFPRHGFEVALAYPSESKRAGQVILRLQMNAVSF